MCLIYPKFHQNRRNDSDLMVFHHGGHPPSQICWVCIWTTHDEHLVVFSVVQHLLGIDAVVLIICSRTVAMLRHEEAIASS